MTADLPLASVFQYLSSVASDRAARELAGLRPYIAAAGNALSETYVVVPRVSLDMLGCEPN